MNLKKFRRGTLLASAMLACLGAGALIDDGRAARTAPPIGPPSGRQPSPIDTDRLDAAEAKRRRKAEKRRAEVARHG